MEVKKRSKKFLLILQGVLGQYEKTLDFTRAAKCNKNVVVKKFSTLQESTTMESGEHKELALELYGFKSPPPSPGQRIRFHITITGFGFQEVFCRVRRLYGVRRGAREERYPRNQWS